MAQKLYLECNSGISGDMSVAALLDLGVDEQILKDTLATLPLTGYQIRISRVKKSGIDACDFDVVLDEDNHDHDMEYLYGHTHTQQEHDHAHSHEGEHAHSQEHEHMHSHEHDHAHSQEDEHAHKHTHGHSHAHVHRGLRDVLEILEHSGMSDRAKEIAGKTFAILAKAEAKAHNLPVNEVHFHEVGAVDSIVDIAAAAICLDQLGVTDVIVTELCEGQGTVRCQHGILPIPVPAVANIVADQGLILHMVPDQGEFVTPTGAAFAAAIRTEEQLPEHFRIRRIGIGAGKRKHTRPGILRAMLLETRDLPRDTIVKLESNIDDCSGEIFGFVMEKLFEAGARDVHYFPVFMKKNRPAWQLNVICTEDKIQELEEIIFRETTTIGIRRIRMERTILRRESCTVSTAYGEGLAKVCTMGQEKRVYPEFESAKKLAEENKIPLREAYAAIEQGYKEEKQSRDF